MRNNIRGFSITQILVASALIGALSATLATLFRGMSKGQQHLEAKTSGLQLKQRILGALQSTSAMKKTGQQNPLVAACVNCVMNPTSCVPTSCPTSTAPQALKITDAGGNSLVPLADATGWALSDDGGNPCSTGSAGCNWKTVANFAQMSAGDPTLHLSGSLLYIPMAGDGPSAPIAPITWQMDVPASLFQGIPAVGAATVSGGCFETTAATCGGGYVQAAAHKRYLCSFSLVRVDNAVYGGGGGVDTLVPCPAFNSVPGWTGPAPAAAGVPGTDGWGPITQQPAGGNPSMWMYATSTTVKVCCPPAS